MVVAADTICGDGSRLDVFMGMEADTICGLWRQTGCEVMAADRMCGYDGRLHLVYIPQGKMAHVE